MKKAVKKDFSRLGFTFLVGTLVILFVQNVVALLVMWLWPALLEDVTFTLLLSALPLYLVGMPVLIALVKRIPGTPPEKHTMSWKQFLLALIMCYAVMYCSNIVGVILTTLIGLIKGEPVYNAVQDIAANANMGVTFVYMVLCAPVMEEYVFRKLIVDRTRRYGEGVAIVLSGMMFGLFHGNLSQFVYAAALGMFLAFIYVKTGELKFTVALHMFINFMGAVVSVLVLKAFPYEEFAEVTASGDYDRILNFVTENLPGLLVYLVYVAMIFALMIAGIVLIIVFRKRFALGEGEVVIPKKERFSTVFFNWGMLFYSLFWLAMLVVNLAV